MDRVRKDGHGKRMPMVTPHCKKGQEGKVMEEEDSECGR